MRTSSGSAATRSRASSFDSLIAHVKARRAVARSSGASAGERWAIARRSLASRGSTFSGSGAEVVPSPWQAGHAPATESNEKRAGDSGG